MAGERARSWVGLLLAWLGAAIGGVLLVRLVLQVLRALGRGATWVHEVAAREVLAGFVLSPVDLVIAVLVLALGMWSLWRHSREGAAGSDGQ